MTPFDIDSKAHRGRGRLLSCKPHPAHHFTNAQHHERSPRTQSSSPTPDAACPSSVFGRSSAHAPRQHGQHPWLPHSSPEGGDSQSWRRALETWAIRGQEDSVETRKDLESCPSCVLVFSINFMFSSCQITTGACVSVHFLTPGLFGDHLYQNACRKQKMRCEGAENPPCRRCRHAGLECLFEKPSREPTLTGEAGLE